MAEKKDWHLKVEPAKILADDCLSRCSLEARGAWMWLLWRMHVEGATGVWEGTPEDLAHSVNCVGHDIRVIVAELRRNRVGDFEDLGDGVIRISNRRMVRDAETRRADRERKNPGMTPECTPHSGVIPSSFRDHSEPIPAPRGRARPDYDYDSSSGTVVETEREDEEPRARFSKAVPGDADQVRAYALMVHLPDHAAEFFDHFEAAGWRMGNGTGRPVKDWQAAYRNWCRRAPQFAPKNGTTNGSRPLTTTQQATRSITERLIEQGYSPDDFR